jgi:transposase-like protein/uncharacterized protein YbaR (Trm112 family)
MDSIILFLFSYINTLHVQINELLLFITHSIPFKEWQHEDSHSPKYQRLTIDTLPVIRKFEKQDYRFLLEYYQLRYNKIVKPVKRRNNREMAIDLCCPRCNAPHDYIYHNNGANGQFLCKVCDERFNVSNREPKPMSLICPHCNHHLARVKSRRAFYVHKCNNSNCSFYLKNLRKMPKDLSNADKSKYKLHYIYREFTIDFFKMDLSMLPNWATSFKFKKKNAHIMGLCLTYHVNLKLSLRQTSQALRDIHNLSISHTMVANYAKTAAVLVKPFVDHYDYNPSNQLSADETYIKVRGLKGYVWFIMDVVSRSILGYQVSDNRSVGPCILTMRMAFKKFKKFPSDLQFIADGYSAYPLAAQQFTLYAGKPVTITPVIGLSNVDVLSKIFRPYKQMIERLNRTFKASYRLTCGFDNLEGAHYSISLWVAYYNFLRPHQKFQFKNALNAVDMLDHADNIPAKWQLLIFLGQQTIQQMQNPQIS